MIGGASVRVGTVYGLGWQRDDAIGVESVPSRSALLYAYLSVRPREKRPPFRPGCGFLPDGTEGAAGVDMADDRG